MTIYPRYRYFYDIKLINLLYLRQPEESLREKLIKYVCISYEYDETIFNRKWL